MIFYISCLFKPGVCSSLIFLMLRIQSKVLIMTTRHHKISPCQLLCLHCYSLLPKPTSLCSPINPATAKSSELTCVEYSFPGPLFLCEVFSQITLTNKNINFRKLRYIWKHMIQSNANNYIHTNVNQKFYTIIQRGKSLKLNNHILCWKSFNVWKEKNRCVNMRCWQGDFGTDSEVKYKW